MITVFVSGTVFFLSYLNLKLKLKISNKLFSLINYFCFYAWLCLISGTFGNFLQNFQQLSAFLLPKKLNAFQMPFHLFSAFHQNFYPWKASLFMTNKNSLLNFGITYRKKLLFDILARTRMKANPFSCSVYCILAEAQYPYV